MDTDSQKHSESLPVPSNSDCPHRGRSRRHRSSLDRARPEARRGGGAASTRPFFKQHVVLRQLRLEPQTVHLGTAMPKPGAAHQDELELAGDQHLQDRRQRVPRDAYVAQDGALGDEERPERDRFSSPWAC